MKSAKTRPVLELLVVAPFLVTIGRNQASRYFRWGLWAVAGLTALEAARQLAK